MADFVTGLRCRECQRAFPAEALHVCDYCFGPLEVAYDYERIAAAVSRERIEAGPRSIWRYRDLLPVDLDEQAPRSTVSPPSSAWASCGSRTTPPTRRARSRTGSSRSR